MTSWQERLEIDRFRRAQIKIGMEVDSLIRREWARLSVDDIDAGRDLMLEKVTTRIHSLRRVAAADAQRYVRNMRTLAVVGAGPVEVPGLFLPASDVLALELAGPAGFKTRVGKGVIDEVAFLAARDQMMAEARKIIMQSGRDTVRLSAEAYGRAIGYRRVSDGDPCAFCAMLVGRGPVYKSEDTSRGSVERIGRSGGWELIYHNHCGCTAVEIFSDDWTPTEAEERFVDDYQAAAEAADAADLPRTYDNILPAMRRDGKYKDSPSRRSKTPTI